ncbi:target of Nesh-SH3 isoform X4 [Oryzias latipes]|uniref:target of Nesh-SH3 isoform X4 n=1 Tax=Oryzias latipes TaxID=8090 RepID=UPI0005CC450D|nr:target of Nesh-SH3 isoform X4 [Oryzias latipes]
MQLQLLVLLTFVVGIALSGPLTSYGVRRQNIKVRISATGDTIVMKFLHPSADTKLEGYILGYGRSMFHKQFIQLPDNGQPYETEFDAEPKYLIAVQPIPANEVKKTCTGKVQMEKPLHLVIGSVTPNSVLLSWGMLLKTPYEGNIMNDCLEDGHYVVRYRERNRKWNYQTCHTSDTVIDNLKPNTVYEFGVQPNSKDGSGVWSKSVTHNISGLSLQERVVTRTIQRTINSKKPLTTSSNSVPFSTQHVSQNRSRSGQPVSPNIASYTTLAPATTTKQEILQTPGLRVPAATKQLFAGRNSTLSLSKTPRLTNQALRPSVPGNKRPNLVGKLSDSDKPMDLKRGEKESFLKPISWDRTKPKQEDRQQTTTVVPAVNSSRVDTNQNTSIFRPLPASDVDIMGRKRFVAPHVIYKTDKKPDEPCSITSSLSYFPDNDEGGDQNVTGPPRAPPSNLTVVTVEGCPSFVILDWEKSDNETREYEVVSTTTGPNGKEVSILTTNQTHTAVENLSPATNYEFKVTPKNELGSGPSSDPVTFSTESADPRVSEYASGKDAIWTQFPFKADEYSECNGKQFVKRTWYRKFVGIQLCNSLRYKIYLSDSLMGKFYNIGDQTGFGEDHCQFVDSFLDGKTGTQMLADQLPSRTGFFRALRQEPVNFGEIGGKSRVTYVGWYECGTPIPGKW